MSLLRVASRIELARDFTEMAMEREAGLPVLDYLIFLISVGILIPNTLRVVRDWRGWSRQRRFGEAIILAGMVALPVLVLVQSAVVSAKNAPRRLSDTQIATLHSHIDRFKGQKVLVVADTRGDDSHDLAESIYAQFVEAGWQLQADPEQRGLQPGVLDVTLIAWGPCEIQIDTAADKRMPGAAQALVDAFGEMDMHPCVRYTNVPPNWLRLIVRRNGGG